MGWVLGGCGGGGNKESGDGNGGVRFGQCCLKDRRLRCFTLPHVCGAGKQNVSKDRRLGCACINTPPCLARNHALLAFDVLERRARRVMRVMVSKARSNHSCIAKTRGGLGVNHYCAGILFFWWEKEAVRTTRRLIKRKDGKARREEQVGGRKPLLPRVPSVFPADNAMRPPRWRLYTSRAASFHSLPSGQIVHRH